MNIPTKDDEQTTTLKVVTKSEFSNHPILGEKIMEQSVQVITVKVRNETIKQPIHLKHPIIMINIIVKKMMLIQLTRLFKFVAFLLFVCLCFISLIDKNYLDLPLTVQLLLFFLYCL